MADKSGAEMKGGEEVLSIRDIKGKNRQRICRRCKMPFGLRNPGTDEKRRRGALKLTPDQRLGHCGVGGGKVQGGKQLESAVNRARMKEEKGRRQDLWRFRAAGSGPKKSRKRFRGPKTELTSHSPREGKGGKRERAPLQNFILFVGRGKDSTA